MTERRDKSEASVPRKRALVSCDRCKLRRARCIRVSPNEPCTDCKISGVQCESKLPRKQRVYGSVETLSLRYRALESLVKGLFPKENVQDLNTIFRIAAVRNISMPANDDYTRADIFNDSNEPAQQQQYQSVQESSMRTQPPPQQSLPAVYQSTSSVVNASSEPSTKQSQRNPFSQVQERSQQTKELIPTRHGTSHYFGPSSSFRLAITIRGLVARCKAAGGVDFQMPPSSNSPDSDPTSRASSSLRPASANPSDEDYMIPDPRRRQSPTSRIGQKRSRSQMEGTEDRWMEHGSSPLTIGDLLPSRPLSDALVSAYFDHVHIFLPLFHRSMFHLRLEAMYSRQAEALKNTKDMGWLICLAMVFFFGCQQLNEHDPEQAQKLQLKYLSFAKTYFPRLLVTTSLANVQALTLLNAHHHIIGQKSTSWLLIGLGARMAITMGLHRDDTNMEFDPMERNTRRQVWYAIYTFERTLCSILGRPTIIDDSEIMMRVPDASMLEQRCPSAEYMGCASQMIKLSYSMRQRAYFDPITAEERSPTVTVASTLLRECNEFFSSIPRHLSVDQSSTAPDQKARILLLHIYYYYMRCIVSRDFLIAKVEKNICHLENRAPPALEDWEMTLVLSEDCVESAYRSIQYMMDASDLGVIGAALDLFFVFHSVLIVCADFLARPRQQHDSPKDIDKKAAVRATLNHIRGLKQLAPTYSILSRIAMQFATMTGVCDKPLVQGQPIDPSLEPQLTPEDDAFRFTDVEDDWFASATTNLGLDFFDLNEAAAGYPTPGATTDSAYTGYLHPNASEVDEWTARTLRGMYSM